MGKTEAGLPQMEDFEGIFDTQVQPLLAQLEAVCEEYNLPFVCVVQYNGGHASAGIGAACQVFGKTTYGLLKKFAVLLQDDHFVSTGKEPG